MNIYLLHGEEDYLIREKIKQLKTGLGDQGASVEQLDGSKLTLETFAAALQTASMFSEKKLVIIRELLPTADDQERYLAVLRELSPEVTAVFLYEKIDGRAKMIKWLKAHGEEIEFKRFAPWELPELEQWLAGLARKDGKKFGVGAARLLVEICGNDLQSLVSELTKVATYIGEREEILEEDVKALASPGEISTFALLDALREKDLKRSLEIFRSLMRNKEDLFQLLGLVASQYRLMLQIRALAGRETDPYKIARLVNGNPYFVKKSLSGLNHYDEKQLKKALADMLETNLKMKTGEPPEILFEMLLTSLCGK